jgi:ABC-type nitrate/sulfonate/bicarbonate transport system permease component
MKPRGIERVAAQAPIAKQPGAHPLGAAGRGRLAGQRIAHRIAVFPPVLGNPQTAAGKWFSGPAHFFFINVQFVRDIVPSVGRALAGFFFSAAIAVPAGLLLGRSRRIGELVEPVIHFARTLPSVTLLPLFLLLLGLGWPMKISLIVFGTLWPILLNTIFGARAVEQEKLEAAKVFRITRWRCLLQIVLPAAGPQIFAGLRVSLS